jgi:hypothetical protein
MGQLGWNEKVGKNLYKKMLSLLDEVEDHKETKILSRSPEFKKLVKKGLEDIKAGRIKPWKEVWDDL